MFEINSNLNVHKEIVENSKIYFIDNFYKNPEEISEYFFKTKAELNKKNQTPSYNSIYFEDRRHSFESREVSKIYEYLGKICKQLPHLRKGNLVLTNMTKFKKNSFNDYKNNYWWPHYDFGYTGILYLNIGNVSSGTNLYENLNPDTSVKKFPKLEHYDPWKPKSNYRLIKTIESKYNQLVLFDGIKFLHGMNICNDDYFSNIYRLNQVFFFNEKEKKYY